MLYFDFFFFCLDKVVVQSNSYQSSSWKLQANLTDDQHSFYAWNPLGWDFFACLVCNYYNQTEGGDKCQYIVNPFFFCQSALVLVHQYIFRATLWNIRGTKKHSITLCGLLIGMSEIYQWSLRKIRYTLLFLIAQFLFQSIYQDSRSKLSKYFVPISMFTLSSLDFCTWKCWFWFFWRVGAGTWKAWQSSVSLKDIQYWFSYCPLLEYLGRHFTFNHKSSKWAHIKHRIW